MPKTYKTFDVKMNKLNVPNKDTVYWCKIIKLPNMGAKKQHIIRIDPIVEKGNEAFVHHMLIYQCNGVPDDHVDKQQSCKVRRLVFHQFFFLGNK